MSGIEKLEALQVVGTSKAAEILGRKKQTLRLWSSEGSGPIRPVKIGGRLGWRIADLERVLRGERVTVTQ